MTTLCTGTRYGSHCDRDTSGRYLCEQCVLRLKAMVKAMPRLLATCAADLGLSEHPTSRESGEPALQGGWWLYLTYPTNHLPVEQISTEDMKAIGDAYELAQPANQVLRNWAVTVSEDKAIDGPPEGRQTVEQLLQVCQWWDAHLDYAVSQSWIDEMQPEVEEAHNRLAREAGLQQVVKRVPGHCPACDEADLRWFGPHKPGDAIRIACRNRECRESMTEAEYLAMRQADAEDAVGAVSQLPQARRCVCGDTRFSHGPACTATKHCSGTNARCGERTPHDEHHWRCGCQAYTETSMEEAA